MSSTGRSISEDTSLNDTNRDVFENCYANYFKNLVSGLHQLYGRNGFDAEDIAHRSFEKLAQRLSQTKIHNPEAFVWRVAQNFALRDMRAKNIRDGFADQTSKHELHCITPERDLLAIEELERVNAALTSLGERRRQIFLLRRIDGLSYTEIAEIIGITRPAVAKHLAKAVLEIDRFLNKR